VFLAPKEMKSAHRNHTLSSLIQQEAIHIFMRGFTGNEIIQLKSRRAGLDGFNDREGICSAETLQKKISCFPHIEHPIDEVFRLFVLAEPMP